LNSLYEKERKKERRKEGKKERKEMVYVPSHIDIV
jgi:hypothetical protein